MGKEQARRNNEESPRDREVQPGTGEKGKSWHSEQPDPDDTEDQLEKSLEDSFPASDPPGATQPMATGWEVIDEKKKADNKA